MEKYLGGDDEVLEGFFNSDEEIDFDTLQTRDHKTANTGLFGKMTSAF